MRLLPLLGLLLAACPPPVSPSSDAGPNEGEGEGEGEGEPFQGWFNEIPNGPVLAAARAGDAVVVVTGSKGPHCAVTVLAADGQLLLERDLGTPCTAGAASSAGAAVAIPAGGTIALDKGPLEVREGTIAIAHVSLDGEVRTVTIEAAYVSSLGMMGDGTTVVATGAGALVVLEPGGSTSTTSTYMGCYGVRLFSGDDAVGAWISPGNDCQVPGATGDHFPVHNPSIGVLRRGDLGFSRALSIPANLELLSLSGATIREGLITLCGQRADDAGGLATLLDVDSGQELLSIEAPRGLTACSLERSGSSWGGSWDELYRLRPEPQTWGVPVVKVNREYPWAHFVTLMGDDLLAVIDVAAQVDRTSPLPAGRVIGRAGGRSALVLRVPPAQLLEPAPYAEALLVDAEARSGNTWVATSNWSYLDVAIDTGSAEVAMVRWEGDAAQLVVERRAADGALRWQAQALVTSEHLLWPPMVACDGAATMAVLSAPSDAEVDLASERFTLPAGHSLVLVLDPSGAVAASEVIDGDVRAIGVREGQATLLSFRAGRGSLTRVAADLGARSEAPFSLRYSAERGPQISLVSELADGDLVLALATVISGDVTFDDGSTLELPMEPSGGGLLRLDPIGRARWFLNLPNSGFVTDTGHLRGTAVNADGTRLTACGRSPGGAIRDERQQIEVGQLRPRRDGAFCIELDAVSGTVLQLRELEEVGSELFGVTYLGAEPIAYLDAPIAGGPRLLRVRDGATSVELHDGYFGWAGRLAGTGNDVWIAHIAPSRASLAPLLPEFEIPGLAGQQSSVLLHVDGANLGF